MEEPIEIHKFLYECNIYTYIYREREGGERGLTVPEDDVVASLRQHEELRDHDCLALRLLC